MNKLFWTFLAFILFNISFQLECSSFPFSDSTCGGHNTDYKLKCQKLSSQANCIEVEVDDFCKIDSSTQECSEEDNIRDDEICTDFGEANKCKRVKLGDNCNLDSSSNCIKTDESIHPNKKCEFDFYKKNCREVDKTCTDYSDETCGNIGTKNGIQCAKFSSGCKEITVDNYCEIKNSICVKKEGQSFNDNQYKCDLDKDKQKCGRREILCIEKTDSTKCGEVINPNCKAIHLTSGSPTLDCREVEIDGECKIEDGDCKDGNNIEAHKQCRFNQTYSGCKATIKDCKDCTSSCSNCKTSNGYTCSEIPTNKCKEILIHESCKVKTDDGTCTFKTSIEGKTCQFNNEETICLLVDSHCSYTSGQCIDKTDGNAPPEGQKCSLINTNECGLINKDCKDFTTSATCEDNKYKNCFWYNITEVCVEYTTDSNCGVYDGECQKTPAAENSFKDNEDCLFSKEISEISDSNFKSAISCTKKDICMGAWEECSIYSIVDKTDCIQGRDYCKKIEIDTYCHVDKNGLCSPKDPNFAETTGLCVFNDVIEKNSCKLRTRDCTEYSLSTCGNLQNCAYYTPYRRCIKTDNYCTIISNECSKRTDVNEQFTKKCGINSVGACVQTDKVCEEIVIGQCNNAPKKDNQQCFHFTDQADCRTITIDEYCYVNSDGECTNSKKISQYEYCGFNTGKTECTIKEKKCEDYNDVLCGKFNPESKLCFNFGSGCIEVQVDNRCKINEKNECVAKGSGQCGFDENNEKCYLKKSDGRYLTSLKYFLLLSLFLIF